MVLEEKIRLGKKSQKPVLHSDLNEKNGTAIFFQLLLWMSGKRENTQLQLVFQ